MSDDQKRERWIRIPYSVVKEKYGMHVYGVRAYYVPQLQFPSRFWVGTLKGTPATNECLKMYLHCESQSVPVTRYDAGLPQGLNTYICKFWEGGKLKQKIRAS